MRWFRLTGIWLLLLLSIGLLQGCFLTRDLWVADNPEGKKQALLACTYLGITRTDDHLLVRLRIDGDQNIVAGSSRDGMAGTNKEYTTKQYRSGEMLVLKSDESRPLIRDPVTWDLLQKVLASEEMKLHFSGRKDGGWVGSLYFIGGFKKLCWVDILTVDSPELPEKALSALYIENDSSTWFGRAVYRLQSIRLESERFVLAGGWAGPDPNTSARLLGYRINNGPVQGEIEPLKQQVLLREQKRESLDLEQYSLIFTDRRFGDEKVPHYYCVSLQDLVIASLLRDLDSMPYMEVPETVEGYVKEGSDPPIPTLTTVHVSVWKPAPYHDSVTTKIAMTPLTVTGDVAIVVTSPIWAPIAAVLYMSLSSTE